MNFKPSDLLIDRIRKNVALVNDCEIISREQTLLNMAQNALNRNMVDSSRTLIQFVGTECFWNKDQRPFFNLYPAVLKCLSNTNLSIKPKDIPRGDLRGIAVLNVKLPNEKPKLIQNVDSFFITFGKRADSSIQSLPGFRVPGDVDSLMVSFESGESIFDSWIKLDESFEDISEREKKGYT